MKPDGSFLSSPGDEQAPDLDIVLNEPSSSSSVDAGAVRIRLDASARQQMIEYAATNTTCELGGMLIGRVVAGTPAIVIVEAVIQAKYTSAVQASITFTHETWQDILAVKDRVYPNQKIIGWFHTHPGFGIFLSNYDLHIHKNFFDLPWQIAYVIDPLAQKEGFFRWENGAVRKTTDYEIFGETTVETPQVMTPHVAPPPPARRNEFAEPRNYAIAVLALCALYAMFFRPPKIRTMTIRQPAPAPVTRAVPAAPPPVVVAKQPPAVSTVWPSYTVQVGDSLWSISQRCYGVAHVAEGMAVIRAANRLSSTRIERGQTLLLPGGTLARANLAPSSPQRKRHAER